MRSPSDSLTHHAYSFRRKFRPTAPALDGARSSLSPLVPMARKMSNTVLHKLLRKGFRLLPEGEASSQGSLGHRHHQIPATRPRTDPVSTGQCTR
jgi:hypothetical protein